MRPGRRIAELAVEHPALAGTWIAVLVGLAGIGGVTGDRRVWAYLTVSIITTAIVATAHRTARFSTALLGSLLLLGVLHLAGGLISAAGGVLYDTWLVEGALRYDQAVHAYGSVCATWASWLLVGAYVDVHRTPPRVQALIACLGGMGKGAINEVLEFLSGGAHVGGYENTGWDLVFDLVGCVAMAVYLCQSRAPQVGTRAIEAVETARQRVRPITVESSREM